MHPVYNVINAARPVTTANQTSTVGTTALAGEESGNRDAAMALPWCGGGRSSSAELGPRWVRAATVAHGQQRSPAVTSAASLK
jgi:hypothetical protein